MSNGRKTVDKVLEAKDSKEFLLYINFWLPRRDGFLVIYFCCSRVQKKSDAAE